MVQKALGIRKKVTIEIFLADLSCKKVFVENLKRFFAGQGIP